MATRMQQRRGTAAQWVSTNSGNGPILAAGEIGFESDTSKFKIGDGVNHWVDLIYQGAADAVEIAQDAVNSALVAGQGLSKSYDDAANTITIANTGVTAISGTANQISLDNSTGSVHVSLAHDVEISGKLTLSQDPSSDLEAVTKQYVDNVSVGLTFNEPVRVATTGNITLSGTQSIDGVTVSIGDRVLVKDQTDAKENGIYDVASSTWSRSSDADNSPTGELAGGDFCLVLEGSTNSGYGYICSNTSAITIGSTDITYVPFNAGKTVQAGDGLWETAPGVISIDNTVATLEGQQTLKNKFINLGENYVSGTIAQFNSAVSDADIATLDGQETLENKTFTAPVINNGSINGSLIDSTSIKLGGVTVATTSDLDTHSSDTTNVHGILDTTALATMQYVDAAVLSSTVDQSTLAGSGLNWNVGTSQFDVDTTSIFTSPTVSTQLTLDGTGDFTISADSDIVLVANTEVYIGSAATGNEVATHTYVDSAVSTHAADTTNIHGIADTSALVTTTDLSSHTSATTSVHGIADTSKLVTTDATSQTISGAITITGDLTVQGTTTTVSATNLEIADPLIYIGGGNSGNSVDLGFVSSFDNGTYQHSGLVRDSSDDKWKLFKGVTDEPTTTVNFGQGSLDTLAVGLLEGDAHLTGTPTAPTAAALTNTTQIATTAYVQEDNKVAYVTESGTSVTIEQATHMFKTVHCTSSSAVTVSIPTDASNDWPVGTYVNIRQMGTGQITVVAATPATTTVVATDSQFKSRVRYSEIVLEKIAANSWIVVGDTAA